MIKKDVGLFHVFFNSALYKKKTENTFTDEGAKEHTNVDKPLVGMNMKTMALLSAKSYLEKYISTELKRMAEDKSKHGEDMFILTKQDQFRYDIHIRLASAIMAITDNLRVHDAQPLMSITQRII